MLKNHLSLRRTAALAVLLALLVAMMTVPAQASSSPATGFGSEFVHVTTDENIGCGETLYCSIIDNPLTNNNPNAILFVTQTGMIGDGVFAEWNENPIGVRYEDGHWQIVNLNMLAMPSGTAFNVLVAEAGPNVYVHEYAAPPPGIPAPAGITYLNHPLANNNPEAIILITQRVGSSGILNPHYVGVWYNNKWGISNQNKSYLPYGATFNVWATPETNSVAFTHVVSEENLAASKAVTVLEHRHFNDNMAAHIQVTPIRRLVGDSHGPANISPIRLIYAQKQWHIANPLVKTIPAGAAFNVVITNMDNLPPDLVNGRFEIQGANAKTPYSWNVVNSLGVSGANSKARRICTESTAKAVYKDCEFRFKGAAKAHHLVQALPVDNVQSGHTVQLTGQISGKNLTPGSVAMRVIAKYPGGGKQKIKIPGEILNAGTYEGVVVMASGELTGKPKKLVVKISMFGTSGRFQVDNVHLRIYNDGLEAAHLPLPLPPAD